MSSRLEASTLATHLAELTRLRCYRYHFDIVDAWKDHTPRPFNSLPDTYSFLVKQPILWRIAYMSQQPRIIHKPYLWSCGNLIGRDVNNLCVLSPFSRVRTGNPHSRPLQYSCPRYIYT